MGGRNCYLSLDAGGKHDIVDVEEAEEGARALLHRAVLGNLRGAEGGGWGGRRLGGGSGECVKRAGRKRVRSDEGTALLVCLVNTVTRMRKMRGLRSCDDRLRGVSVCDRAMIG